MGVPIPGTEVRIAEDGEILVRGPHVFKGYFKDPEATAAVLENGWLHSGDLGRFDEDGFLYVTGRKKEIIITAGGKNIAPNNIEAALKESPYVNEAVVIGDGRKYLTALLTLEPDAAAAFAREKGLDPREVHKAPELLELLEAHVQRVNENLAQVEQIKKFTVLERNFSVEAGELTPTMKVKRRVVQEHFQAEIDRMYADAVQARAAGDRQ